MARSPKPVRLAAAGIRFAPEYHRRIELLSVRLSALRAQREGFGVSRLAGGGQEFVGYRPYRPGEDLRMLDWSLIARLDRPYVRVTRREASERWALVVDTSASMGVGPPGKLQWAAEVACAVAALGLRAGVTVDVFLTSGRTLQARRQADLRGLLSFFEAERAKGGRGLMDWIGPKRLAPDVGRVFLFGDFVDGDPEPLRSLLRRGRELALLQVLAPLELSPPANGAVEWADPEGASRVTLAVDGASRADYEVRLRACVEALETFARRHGSSHRCWSSATPFEDAVRALSVTPN